jgi:hypothetical protein
MVLSLFPVENRLASILSVSVVSLRRDTNGAEQ